MELRPYQKTALKKIKNAYLKGEQKQVIVLATGLGKTVIFSHLINDITRYFNKKALVLVHREELLTQAKEKLLQVNPNLDIGLEMAEQTADGDHHVIIASVATIGRKGNKRIEKFNPDDFIAIVTDEAHHSSASTYRNVYEYFGVNKSGSDNNKKILLLGVTATPSRNDNAGIDQVYDKVTYEYGIIKGIQDTYLAPIRGFRIDTTTDLTTVGEVGGDFNQGELADAVNNQTRNGLIVKAYKDKVPGQQALIFAVDVQHTKDLTDAFITAGIDARYVSGTTPKEERREMLADFSKKKFQVLINCAVLTEGFDEPAISAILMARPTQSGILFQQMIGRGTRLAEGKSYLTIIDFVDNTYKQTLKTTASLLGLEGKLDFKGEDILTVKEKIDELLELAPNVNLDDLDIHKIQYAIEEVDLLSGLKIPEEISKDTYLDWHRYIEGHYMLSMPEKRTIHIVQAVTGEYQIIDDGIDADTERRKSFQVQTEQTMKEALRVADEYVAENYPELKVLVSTRSAWRKKAPNDKQLELLKKLGVGEMAMLQLDRGTASRLITKLLTISKRRKFSKKH